MRDDPWTAANRDKEQKVTIVPKRKQAAETASPPARPTISGPFWTGKKSAPDIPKPQAAADRDADYRGERHPARQRLFNTLISLRVAIEDFEPTIAGLVLSSYFAGFTLAAMRCGRIIERVGHIRAYAAFAGLVVAATASGSTPSRSRPFSWFAIVGRAILDLDSLREAEAQRRATKLALWRFYWR